jgi:hypothetical protein
MGRKRKLSVPEAEPHPSKVPLKIPPIRKDEAPQTVIEEGSGLHKVKRPADRTTGELKRLRGENEPVSTEWVDPVESILGDIEDRLMMLKWILEERERKAELSSAGNSSAPPENTGEENSDTKIDCLNMKGIESLISKIGDFYDGTCLTTRPAVGGSPHLGSIVSRG